MSEPLTADTITDEQIRELRERASEHGEGADDGHGGYYGAAEMLNICDEALGDFDYGDLALDVTDVWRASRVDWARARCTEILNARAKGPE